MPHRSRALAVLAVVAVVWLLRAAAPVLVPVAFALFLVVLLDPVRQRLAERVPDRLAVALAFALAVTGLGAFGWVVVEALDEAAEGLLGYADRFESLGRSIEAGPVGLPDAESARSLARSLAAGVWQTAGAVVLVYALFALVLAEVPEWGRTLRDRFAAPVSGRLVEVADRVSRKVRRFVGVQAFTSALTGALTGLFCWAFGLDLALVWGVLAGVLNVVPTLGSIVAVVPPTLFALVQYGLGWEVAAVLAGLAVIQIVLGAYVDPRLQGRYLELSASMMLVSIVFWTWAWGLPGAFIAVPLTAAVVVAFGEFEETRWVRRLLTRGGPPEPQPDDPGPR